MHHVITLTSRCAAILLAATLSAGAPAWAQAWDSSSAAAMSGRVSELEAQIRQLNGQVEQLNHTVRSLEDQLRRYSEDTEYRFQELGQGSGDGAYYASSGGGTSAQPDAGPTTAVPEPGVGQPPQVLGQIPGGPVDLSPGGSGWGGLGGTDGSGQGWDGGGMQTASLPAATGDPGQDYDVAYGHILRGEFDVAEGSFRRFLESYPDDEMAGNAQYWLGESMFARGRYREAADAFLAGYTDHPDNAKAPDSLFKLGMSLKELGQRDAACATLAEIGRNYPNASQAVRERARNEIERSGC